MLGFEKDYSDAERILLDVNYRCVDPRSKVRGSRSPVIKNTFPERNP